MEEKTWGMRFNQRPDYQRLSKGQKPQGCPDWFETRQISTWQEQGLVLWNNVNKHIEVLQGGESLKLLKELHFQDNWKSDGISVTRLVHKIEFQLPPRGRRKKMEQESKIDTGKSETVYEEIVHLPPEAGPELIELLEEKKPILFDMAEKEKKRWDDALRQFWDFAFESFHKQEQSELDFTNRPLEWHSHSPDQWTCHYQSAEGRICLAKKKWWCYAHVARPRLAGQSHYFLKLLEAVEWIEKEIVDLANQPEVPERAPHFLPEEQIQANRARLRKKLLDTPFWIDPAAMEPKQISYKLFIELDAKPVSFKTMELECGDTIRYEVRYLSPSKLAAAVNLDIDRFHVDQPIGENTDWYQVTSLTTYFQENSAADQAQRAWDQSRIIQQFKMGKISRARYGYQEVETEFVTYLGACQEPDRPWDQPEIRKDYMEDWAFRETLCFALDITDYRDYLGANPEFISDEQILRAMHEIRSRSKFLPETIRRESKVWLAEHEPLE